MLEDTDLENINDTELKNLAINCHSCLREHGNKLNYISYLKSMHNKECNKAIIRCFKNIKINEIENFIDNIECISNTRKNFTKT